MLLNQVTKKNIGLLILVTWLLLSFSRIAFAKETEWESGAYNGSFLSRIEAGLFIELEGIQEHSIDPDEDTQTFRETAFSVDLELETDISEQWNAEMTISFDDQEGVYFDEALLIYHSAEDDEAESVSWQFRLGKMTLPFGHYESYLLSDPMTQELGESKKNALIFELEKSFFNLGLGIFKGNEINGNDTEVITLAIINLPSLLEDQLQSNLGVSYLSNLADSDELTDYIDHELEIDRIEETMEGISAFVSLTYLEQLFIDVEYMQALDALQEEPGFKPKVWNLELGYQIQDNLVMGFRYGKSKNANDFLSRVQRGLGAQYEINSNVLLGVEYIEKLANDGEKINTITLQLAMWL